RPKDVKSAFKPRVIRDSPHFDAELLGAFEAWVLERTPGFGYRRELTGSYENSVVYGLILLMDPEEPLPAGERSRFEAAARRAPGHPEIERRIAQRLVNENDVNGAIRCLEKIIKNSPYCTPAYRLLFSLCRKAEIAVPESVLTPQAVMGC